MEKKKNRLFPIFLFCMYLCIVSCYQDKEGCTDYYAENFDVAADINCCCQYPSVQLQSKFLVRDTSWTSDSILYDLNGLPYYVDDVAYAFHDLRLTGSRDIEWRDTFVNSNSMQSVFPGMFAMNTVYRNFMIAPLKSEITFSHIETRIGLPDALDTIPYDSLSTTHILSKFKILYDSVKTQWYDMAIRIIPDTAEREKGRWIKCNSSDLYRTDIDLENQVGKDLSMFLYVDLTTLMENFSLTDSPEMQRSKITSKSLDALAIKEE